MAPTPQTKNINSLLDQCWASVCDAGPALTQQWVNLSCLQGQAIVFYGRCGRVDHTCGPVCIRPHLHLHNSPHGQ